LIGIAVDPSDPSGNTYRLSLSKRYCDDVTADPSSPGGIGASIEVPDDLGERDVWDDSDIVQVHPSTVLGARSLVLLKGETPLACGDVTKFSPNGGRRSGPPISSATQLKLVKGSGLTGLVSAIEKPRRVTVDGIVTCRAEARCSQLMEEEGIFYFARARCGEPARKGPAFTLGPEIANLSGNVIDLATPLATTRRKPKHAVTRTSRSLRLMLAGKDVACGRVRVDGQAGTTLVD
jgi:hypothetical protein